MSYYRKTPELDEKQQAEFDAYLVDQYKRDFDLAWSIANTFGIIDDFRVKATISVFDKLATPRIYLLQAWLHRKSQEAAGVLEAGTT